MNLEEYVIDGYYPTIGIECHVQLKTKTKLFSSVSNEAIGTEPNTLVSHICFGLPGALPVLNEEAVRLAAKAAYALGTKPQSFSKFDRKHYFYPDLPKGYQISQFDEPIILGGSIEIRLEDGKTKIINITRAHMEEDAGKSTHPSGADYSLVDLNRAGTPLLEIVSEPEIHSSAEAKAFAKELWLRMKYAGVSDVDLYHGNMRFDVNVSVSKDPNVLGMRSETKNLNSFKSVERAVDYEIKRQIELLNSGESVVQETRGWLDDKQKTVSQRSKEDAHDYRYFPDPDIPPIVLDDEYLKNIEKNLPTLLGEWRIRLNKLDLSDQITETILESSAELDIRMLDIFNGCDDSKQAIKQAQTFASWMTNYEVPIVRKRKESDADIAVEPRWRSDIYNAIFSRSDTGAISSNTVKLAFEELLFNPSTDDVGGWVDSWLEKNNLVQMNDDNELEKIIKQVLSENPQPVADVKAGEMKAIGFLVGQVMKASQGKANPGAVQQLIKKQLGV